MALSRRPYAGGLWPPLTPDARSRHLAAMAFDGATRPSGRSLFGEGHGNRSRVAASRSQRSDRSGCAGPAVGRLTASAAKRFPFAPIRRAGGDTPKRRQLWLSRLKADRPPGARQDSAGLSTPVAVIEDAPRSWPGASEFHRSSANKCYCRGLPYFCGHRTDCRNSHETFCTRSFKRTMSTARGVRFAPYFRPVPCSEWPMS